MAETDLKKPLLVIFIGIFFLLAPFGNYLLSLYAENVSNWYLPEIWIALLPSVHPQELIWQGLIVISGIAILNQHKWSWALAIITLIILAIKSLIMGVFIPMMEGHQVDISQFVFMIPTIGFLVLIHYFRYPYLDRRESLFGTTYQRVSISVPVVLKLSIGESLANLVNISNSGLLIELNEDIKESIDFLKEKLIIGIDKELNLNFIFIRKDNKRIAGRFNFENSNQKNLLKQWIKDHKKRS